MKETEWLHGGIESPPPSLGDQPYKLWCVFSFQGSRPFPFRLKCVVAIGHLLRHLQTSCCPPSMEDSELSSTRRSRRTVNLRASATSSLPLRRWTSSMGHQHLKLRASQVRQPSRRPRYARWLAGRLRLPCPFNFTWTRPWIRWLAFTGSRPRMLR